MTYNRPLRFTILHLAQRFFMDAETFTIHSPGKVLLSQSFDYTYPYRSRPD